VTAALDARFASPNPAERAFACDLAADDPNAVLLIDRLETALGDPAPRVAQRAADALARLAERTPEVDRVLRRALRGERTNARWAAAFALARCAPPEAAWLPALVEALDHPAGDVRWAALRQLVSSAPLLPEVPPLIQGLAADDPRPRVRRMAAHGLRRLANPDD
jgi:HEAT repeat protein